jgi:hypothetical protein
MKHSIFLAVILVLAFGGVAAAQDDWDKSSIAITGACQADGSAEFTVVNNGADMTGPSAWREYEADVLTADGTFQLAAGANQTWTFAASGVPIRFEADQRPGHPGASAPKLTLTCSAPTAVTLRAFGATSASVLASICQRGVVTDFFARPGGGVVYVLRSGHAFADAYWTVRHFWKTQRVVVCGGIVK